MSPLKDNIRTLILGGRGCRLKLNVHVKGGGGLKLQNLSVLTLYMTPSYSYNTLNGKIVKNSAARKIIWAAGGMLFLLFLLELCKIFPK